MLIQMNILYLTFLKVELIYKLKYIIGHGYRESKTISKEINF